MREPNILFLKPRKVAGTSFEIALSKFAGPNDILTPIDKEDETLRETLGFRSAQNYNFAIMNFKMAEQLCKTFKWKYPRKYFQHISAEKTRSRLGAASFDRAFKISIVRNPFDVLVSWYFWKKNSKRGCGTLEEWIRENKRLININDEQYKIEEKVVVDFFIRYEHFGEDILALEKIRPEIAGTASIFSSLKAKGGTRPEGTKPKEVLAAHEGFVLEVTRANQFLIDRFGYELN